MIDFVYPLGSGSLHHDEELKLSMQSVQRFAQFPHRFIVIGDRPRMKTEVQYNFFEAEDISCHKQLNTVGKMKMICKNPFVSEDFVWMNDDFYFAKPVELADIKIFDQGSLDSHIAHRSERPNNYLRSLQNTKSQLIEHGLPTKDFELHVPFPVRKSLMRVTMKTFDWSDNRTPLMRSCYANQHGAASEFMDDLKFDSPVNKSEFLRRVGERKFFSIGDGGLVKPSDLRACIQNLIV